MPRRAVMAPWAWGLQWTRVLGPRPRRCVGTAIRRGPGQHALVLRVAKAYAPCPGSEAVFYGVRYHEADSMLSGRCGALVALLGAVSGVATSYRSLCGMG